MAEHETKERRERERETEQEAAPPDSKQSIPAHVVFGVVQIAPGQ